MFGKHWVAFAPDWLIYDFKQKRITKKRGVYEGPRGVKYFYKLVHVDDETLLDEIEILQRLSSRFVQRLEWIWPNVSVVHMFFEWVDVSLQELLDQRSRLSNNESRHIFTEMLRALMYLQESGIVHRNIKPSTILLTSNVKVKLSGFVVAIRLEGRPFKLAPPAGCYLTIPPEADEEIASPAWDVWSAGVVLYLMMTGQYPFSPTSSSYPLREAVNSTFTQIKEASFRPEAVGFQSGNASALLEQVFTGQWSERPSAKDLLSFDFVDPVTVVSPFATYTLKRLLRYRLEGRSKILRAPVCFGCVFHRVKESLKQRSNFSTEKETSIMPATTPDLNCEKQHSKAPLWIVHWADFTHKFGFCTTFSNGCASILFNDRSSVTCDLAGTTHYFEKDGTGWRFHLRRVPRTLKYKIGYLQWWRKETAGKVANTAPNTSGLRNWFRTEAGILLTFDGVLQFDFIDGTRLVVSSSHILKFPKYGGCQLNRWTSPLNPSALCDQIAHLDSVVDKINENYPGNFQ